MSIRQRDYILRMIEQLSEAIARIAGARTAGRLDEADLLIRETADGILGPLRSMVDKLDAASAVRLLDSPEKVRAYAMLLAEEGSIHDLRGNTKQARQAYRRALELRVESTRGVAQLEPSDRDAIEALRNKLGVS